MYSLIGLVVGTNAPIVVNVSYSMVPELTRGDIIFMQGASPSQINAKEVSLREYLEFKNFDDIAEAICFNKKDAVEEPCKISAQKYLAGLISSPDFTTTKIKFVDGQEIELNKEGDIIVYFLQEQGILVIHRAVTKINALDGTYFLTKGDSINNSLIDQISLSSKPLKSDRISGKSILKIPLLGYTKLLLVDDVALLIFGCPYNTCYFP